MTKSTEPPIGRCCRSHGDWQSLTNHLLADFNHVSAEAVINELEQARRASEFFRLGHADALDCAELIVRHRVVAATRDDSQSTQTPAEQAG
jgi:hypothetical protein